MWGETLDEISIAKTLADMKINNKNEPMNIWMMQCVGFKVSISKGFVDLS